MSLWTVVVGWVGVAALFALASGLMLRALPGRAIVAAVVESLVLTLLAALWFGTAGHGGWLLVFALLGLLVAGSQVFKQLGVKEPGERPDVRVILLDLLRYLLAGAFLAWRLG